MKEKIIELRKNKKSVKEIAKTLNCAQSTVSYHINKCGLGGNISKKTLEYDHTSLEVKNVIRLRENGLTYDEIFIKTTLSKDIVKKIFRDFKLNKQTFKIKKLDGDLVCKKYVELKSLRKTAEYFKCSREKIRKYIPDNLVKKTYSKYNGDKKKAVINWRIRTKQKLVDYKGGCCEKCGYDKCIKALQFHHTNPDEKDFNISGKSYSFERLKKEVDKCIMVCANCHIEIHDTMKNYHK